MVVLPFVIGNTKRRAITVYSFLLQLHAIRITYTVYACVQTEPSSIILQPKQNGENMSNENEIFSVQMCRGFVASCHPHILKNIYWNTRTIHIPILNSTAYTKGHTCKLCITWICVLVKPQTCERIQTLNGTITKVSCVRPNDLCPQKNCLKKKINKNENAFSPANRRKSLAAFARKTKFHKICRSAYRMHDVPGAHPNIYSLHTAINYSDSNSEDTQIMESVSE